AKEFKYKIFVLTVENRHNGKNTHNVSDEQVKKMAEKYKVILM
ncbi:MAG TPA: ATP-binding protein, partial [Bacteroidia bacterium]